jgi:hypothetical protein
VIACAENHKSREGAMPPPSAPKNNVIRPKNNIFIRLEVLGGAQLVGVATVIVVQEDRLGAR